MNLLAIDLNGRYQDAAVGGFELTTSNPGVLFAPSENFDGVGAEAVQQGQLCPGFGFLCDIDSLTVGAGAFSGYVSSIKVALVPAVVPLPSGVLLLLSALGGLLAWRRAQIPS